ncbi:MAG: 4Fe-4S binding protein [Coriobacteriales bacterium]|jgi:ferredoxin-type protein NapH|nr:4Fe-4S binding protein [Coriobacteriales bacterium]
MKKGKSTRIRLAVMLGFMIIVAVGYFTAGGMGNFCGIGFDTITLICPLGALLVMIAERTAIPLAVLSVVVVLLICALLGKVFCAWGCPAHFLTQLSRPGRRGRRGHKKRLAASCSAYQTTPSDSTSRGCHGIKLDSRHGILATALLTTLIFGFPVFCLVCPVGLIFATVLLVMRLFVFGEITWTLVVFPLIIAIELFLLPRWCNNFCPLGALLSVFSGLNRTFQPRIDTSICRRTARGLSCNLCERACPEGINLHDIKAGRTTLNDCSKCRICADVCPEHAVSFPFWVRKNDAKEKTVKESE